MTHGPWPWQDLLRSINKQTLHDILGKTAGVVGFDFRLLAGELDCNYTRGLDSGERHVFELLRSDGQAWYLHFHKNGKLDKPRAIEAHVLAFERQNTQERKCSYAATVPRVP